MIKEVKFNKNKKGLSPIIATVLLVSISLALAVIIFLWAKSFFVEAIMKNGASIEDACSVVSFETDYDYANGKISVENTGEIPIYGFEIKTKSGGEIVNLGEGVEGTEVGETKSLDLVIDGGVSELIVAPILLGEDDASRKKWVCDKEFSKTIEVENLD